MYEMYQILFIHNKFHPKYTEFRDTNEYLFLGANDKNIVYLAFLFGAAGCHPHSHHSSHHCHFHIHHHQLNVSCLFLPSDPFFDFIYEKKNI